MSLDVSADLAAILDDCGNASIVTARGSIDGRFVVEPIEVETAAGAIVQSSELVLYTSRAELDRAELVVDAWLDIDGDRYYVSDIPDPDSTGLVRVELKQ